jgi:hypothetical protein
MAISRKAVPADAAECAVQGFSMTTLLFCAF